MKTLLSIEKATAKTVATGNIIPYLIFRFHEEVSICRYHELSHIYCTNRVRDGVSPKTLQKLMGQDIPKHGKIYQSMVRYTRYIDF